MSKTASVTCQQCGALNEVSLPDDSFDEQLRSASFSFACRACSATLPELPPAIDDEVPTPRQLP